MTTVSTRKPARGMLALIALAAHLPLPKGIDIFDKEVPSITLTFAFIREGAAWATDRGARILPPNVHTGGGTTTTHLTYETPIYWHGWRIDVSAFEPGSVTGDDQLAADQTAALTELAEARS